MIGLDINETTEVEVAGGKWRVGVVPWGKMEALRLALGEAADARTAASQKVIDAKGDEAATAAAVREWQRASVPYLEACAEIVRWGVRSTPVERLNAIPMGSEKADGVEVQVLDRRVVEVLKRTRGPEELDEDGKPKLTPRLVDSLALAVITENDVSAEDLLGFK